MDKIIRYILLIIVLFLIVVVSLHFLGITTLVFESAHKIQRHEINIGFIRLIGTLIILAITFVSCVIASSIAQKKGRSTLLWIFICIFINAWGVLILHCLPSKKGAN
jgi:hypothetical protein